MIGYANSAGKVARAGSKAAAVVLAGSMMFAASSAFADTTARVMKYYAYLSSHTQSPDAQAVYDALLAQALADLDAGLPGKAVLSNVSEYAAEALVEVGGSDAPGAVALYDKVLAGAEKINSPVAGELIDGALDEIGEEGCVTISCN